jgi:phosphoglucomutase
MSQELSPEIIAKAKQWLAPSYDESTRHQVQDWLNNDAKSLLEAFYSDLEFGTGGLRGVMGVGTMRINKYTIGMATQGLANYIHQQFPSQTSSVAIAHDSRNNSRFFAEISAAVLSANGIHVHLFDELRPTPLLSYAVRELKCQAGIVITASHNPKEYNGYKVYWQDGAQVLPPHDKGIIAEVRKVTSIDDVKFDSKKEFIHSIGPEVEESYFEKMESIIHSKKEIKLASDLKIVYTSIHGAGITMVPKALERLGFQHLSVVQDQAVPDGNFSTVVSPNPEEKEALDMALQLAEKEGADLVLGTDPDTDRVGLAVRDDSGKLVLLNGNQTGSLLVYYQLQQWKKEGKLDGKQYVAKTIVTSDIINDLANGYGVKYYETLTGFKYIAGVMGEKEGQEIFIGGGEESYGYLVGEFVRDKDAVISAVVMAEIAAWCKCNGTSLWGMMMEMYQRFGMYYEQLVSITMKGLDGLQQIEQKMIELRANPPVSLGGSPVAQVMDIQEGTSRNLRTGEVVKLGLPKSNVLQFILEDGSKISARPSGTEPKIKFYFSLKSPMKNAEEYHPKVASMTERIGTIQKELGL